MKKLIILGLVLLMVVVFATAAFSKAEKVDLIQCPINYPSPELLPGGGFVIFNNSSGVGHNLELTVSLKGLVPDTAYDIHLFVDGVGTLVGTVITNASGNANFNMNDLLDPGDRLLNIDVTLEGSGADVFETDGIHTAGGTLMTFK